MEAQSRSSVTTTIELSNAGNLTLEYSLDFDDSWVASSVSIGTIAPLDTENVSLTVQCGDEIGTQSGTLQINSNGGVKSIPIELTCTQQPTPVLSNISTPVNLATGIGTSADGSITFDNSGNALLEYSLSQAPAWLELSDVDGIVKMGETESISLTAICPTRVSKLEGSVSITSNGGDALVSLSLDCRGPILSNVTPLLFEFSAKIGQTDSQYLSLSNTGNESLNYTVSSISEWLCTDDQGSADCQTGSVEFSDTLLAGETYSFPITAKCLSSRTEQLEGVLSITGNNETRSIPATLNCEPEALLAAEAIIKPIEAKIFRFIWTDSIGADYYRLLESVDGLSDFEILSSRIEPGVGQYDHIVPLHLRSKATYQLQSCNNDGCVNSMNIPVQGNLANAIGFISGDLESNFGQAIDISEDGSTLAVYQNSPLAVNIYRNASTTEQAPNWELEKVLDFEGSSQAGYEDNRYIISLNKTGNKIAIGLPETLHDRCDCFFGICANL